MKFKKLLSTVLMSTLLVGSIGTNAFALSGQITINFKDASQAKWALKHISKMAQKDIIKGYNGGLFKPNNPVTHSEAVVLAMKAAGYEIKETVTGSVYLPYKDTKSIPAWAKPAISLAESKGFIPDENSVNFQPNKPASRQWVTELIVSAFGYEDEAKEKSDVELPFTDIDAIDPDVIGFIAVALEENIINGMPNGTFQPNKPVTRAEIAVMLGLADAEITPPVQKQVRIEGIVFDVVYDAEGSKLGTITIKNDDEEETYDIDKNAAIYINDNQSTLANISVGAKVELVLNEDNIVVFIEVKPICFRGILKSVDDNKIVVNAVYKGDTQADKEYTVNDDTRILLNGKTTTLENLKIGAIVKLTLTPDDTVETIKATYLPKKIIKKVEKKIIKETIKNIKHNKDEAKKDEKNKK